MMDLRADERTCLFIDGASLYAASRGLGFDVDYRNLLRFFRGRSRLVRAYYYAALLETAGLSPTGTLGARWVRLLIQRDWIERNADGDLLATDKMVAILSGYFART